MFRIVNISESAAEINVIGPIGQSFFEDGVDAVAFGKQVATVGSRDALVRIHSPGGDAFDAMHMVDRLRLLAGKVTTRVEGLAASAASILFMAGEEREITPNSSIMIHEPMTGTWGPIVDHETSIARLAGMRARMVDLYSGDSRLSPAAASEMIAGGELRETWLDADQAVADGLATRVVDSDYAIAAAASHRVNLDVLARFAKHIPGHLRPGSEEHEKARAVRVKLAHMRAMLDKMGEHG